MAQHGSVISLAGASHPRYGWNQEYHAYVVSVFDAKYDASSNWNKIYVLAICFIRLGTCKQKPLCKQLNSDSSCHPCHRHWNEVEWNPSQQERPLASSSGGIQIFVKINNSVPKHICDGSLITFEWILTAAHCTRKGTNVIYYVGAGRSDNLHQRFPSGSMKFLHGQTRRSRLFYRHYKYDNEHQEHDIALMKVQEPFHPSSSLVPVKLPTHTEASDLTELYKTCYIGGWGLTGANFMQIFDHSRNVWKYNQDVQKTSKLVHVVLPLISNKQCRRIWHGESGVAFEVLDTQICTLYYPGRKSVCRGDSGGPLMCGSAQYGIASWSFSCGKPRIGADVYTRVDKYLDWINATINSLDLNFEYRSNVKRVDTNMDYYMNPDIDISSKQQSHIHANCDIVLTVVFSILLYIIIYNSR